MTEGGNIMRRKDREVLDNEEILNILIRSNTIHVAMYGDKFPYVVPVSFGMEESDGKPVIYFHCAKEGLKTEYLKKNADVCVEADTFFRVQKTEHGITTRYESVIGFGKCEEVTSEEEIIKGLKLILEHYDNENYDVEICKGVSNLKMYRITLEEITGKANPVV